jgi:hypothetical protein
MFMLKLKKNGLSVQWRVDFSENTYIVGDIDLNSLIELLKAVRDKVEELGG